jgi:hypothetical protein
MFFFSLEEIEKEIPEDLKEKEVSIRGAHNLKAPGIPEYEVRMAYGDIVLMISVLYLYLRDQEKIRTEEDILWNSYYKGKFQKMADRLSEQIGYDYWKAYERCQKKQEKQDNSDIGEEAMALTVKRARKEAEKKEKEELAKIQEKEGDNDT